MQKEMPSAYNSKETEDRIYKTWEESGLFNPDNLSGEPFSMMLPPPNVTGTLHIGHAYEDTLQDIVIRFQRMRGKKVLWLPGTDHAPIATESKVVKLLEKEEGKRKSNFSRDEFVAKVNKFAQESHDTIVNQVRKMGASVDWSREAYTFDDKRNLAVRTAFKMMFDLGLIYRGDRVVNWDPKGQTTISDDEIVREERKAKMYTFKYSAGFPISISSTRPETKVGDVAVAVHPEDDRYKNFVGKEYDAVFCGVPIHIKIIADERQSRLHGYKKKLYDAIKEFYGVVSAVQISYFGNDTFIALVDETSTIKGAQMIEIMRKKAAEFNAIVHRQFPKEIAKVAIGLGNFYRGKDGIVLAYEEAKVSLQLGLNFEEHKPLFHIDDLGMIAILAGGNKRWQENFVRNLLTQLMPEKYLIETVDVFFNENMSLTQTAKNLNIHRNTLLYRLSKIKKITGLDPRNFNDAVKLKLASILSVLQEKERA